VYAGYPVVCLVKFAVNVISKSKENESHFTSRHSFMYTQYASRDNYICTQGYFHIVYVYISAGISNVMYLAR